MRSNTIRILVLVLAAALIAGLTVMLTLPAIGAPDSRKDYSSREKICVAYTYSSCPYYCYRQCIPSACGPDRSCTADCEGRGSCRYDPARKGGGDK